MYLIIGLGNPDKQYEGTRHNVGFKFLDALAKEMKASEFVLEKKLEAEIASGKFNDQKVILAKPQTYVNNSGVAVKKIKTFYKLKNENIIIIHDDLDVPFGSTKLTPESGPGGHKGVASIINHLKTEKIYRLKIGIGNSKLKLARSQSSDEKRKELIGNLVLSSFTSTEKEDLKKIIKEGLAKLTQIVS
ncbi:MAG: aminoacyl-tRNA hydrolase [bacterium]|nr:aminoacyl-tRNA hydrolase [bacterium]